MDSSRFELSLNNIISIMNRGGWLSCLRRETVVSSLSAVVLPVFNSRSRQNYECPGLLP